MTLPFLCLFRAEQIFAEEGGAARARTCDRHAAAALRIAIRGSRVNGRSLIVRLNASLSLSSSIIVIIIRFTVRGAAVCVCAESVRFSSLFLSLSCHCSSRSTKCSIEVIESLFAYFDHCLASDMTETWHRCKCGKFCCSFVRLFVSS